MLKDIQRALEDLERASDRNYLDRTHGFHQVRATLLIAQAIAELTELVGSELDRRGNKDLYSP